MRCELRGNRKCSNNYFSFTLARRSNSFLLYGTKSRICVLLHLRYSYGSVRPCYSGSMEPAFHRGDLLFLTKYQDEQVRVGEIVVFKVEGRDIPIVHRVLKLHEK